MPDALPLQREEHDPNQECQEAHTHRLKEAPCVRWQKLNFDDLLLIQGEQTSR